jgi:hypothetical protein
VSEPQQPTGGAEERLPTAAEALLSSVHLLITIGFEATGLRPGSSRDLAECQRAIDGVRALMPLLEGALPADAYREYRQALADLQMAYAEAVRPPAAPAEDAPEPSVETPERPKIWTPRGDV